MDNDDYLRLPDDPAELLSPSLLVDRGLIERNLKAMIELARGADRLRPHVKTHKMPAIVRMCELLGIHQHKVATIAEAEMVAAAGGTDVLIAYPLVGPNIGRLARLVETYPATTFRALVDHPDAARALSEGMSGASLHASLPVLIDLDVGMGRTGIAPGDDAIALAALIDRLPNLAFDGLSAYDGHIRETELAARGHRRRRDRADAATARRHRAAGAGGRAARDGRYADVPDPCGA